MSDQLIQLTCSLLHEAFDNGELGLMSRFLNVHGL